MIRKKNHPLPHSKKMDIMAYEEEILVVNNEGKQIQYDSKENECNGHGVFLFFITS